MARLRVYVTGSVTLERGATLVPQARFPGRQGRLAFAVLATRRGESIGYDELADVLWNGTPPPAWEAALRAIVSKLRVLLAVAGVRDDAIPSAFGCYRLALPHDAWVDVEAADDGVHRAEAALASGDPDLAIGWALVAASIAARPFLPAEDGAFVQQWRERLRTIRVRALEARGAALLSRGQFALAARDAGLAIELAPFRESALQLLMRAHVAAGNPAEALAAFERARRVIADELGVDPSVESRALFAEILTGP